MNRRPRLWLRSITATVLGGVLLSSCQGQFRDAVAFSMRSYVLDVLLDPETVISGLLGVDPDDPQNGTQ